MSGSDNLMAGFRGGTDAAQDILGLLIQSKIRKGERRDLMQEEFDLYKQKLPIARAETAATEQMKSDIDYKRAIALMGPQEASKIRVAQATPGMVYDSENDTFKLAPAAGRITTKQKESKEVGLETLIRETADNLPKQRTSAASQKTNIESIDKAISLIDKGVTGKGGQLKAFLAPYAEFAGTGTEGMDDAQTFQLLTRVIVGPMRLDIIGPGPVSEWEQKLMQQISGGGGTAKAASKELLTTYRRLAESKIKDYNTSVAGAHTLSPRFKDLYQPIEANSNVPSPSDISGEINMDSKKAALRKKLGL